MPGSGCKARYRLRRRSLLPGAENFRNRPPHSRYRPVGGRRPGAAAQAQFQIAGPARLHRQLQFFQRDVIIQTVLRPVSARHKLLLPDFRRIQSVSGRIRDGNRDQPVAALRVHPAQRKAQAQQRIAQSGKGLPVQRIRLQLRRAHGMASGIGPQHCFFHGMGQLGPMKTQIGCHTGSNKQCGCQLPPMAAQPVDPDIFH